MKIWISHKGLYADVIADVEPIEPKEVSLDPSEELNADKLEGKYNDETRKYPFRGFP